MQYVALIFLSVGTFFIFLAGVGLVRMPTLFLRMQATSKAPTLGVILMLCGLGILKPETEIFTKGAVICILLLLTAPMAAHAIALAAKKQRYDK